MGGGGSIQGMITSLNNNRRLLRKSHFFPKERSFLNRKREFCNTAGGIENLRSASKEELLEIRKTIINKRRKTHLITFVLFLFIASLVIYISYGLFKSNADYLSAQEKREFKVKNDKYLFFISDGDTYLENGQWHNALFQYNKALEIFPNDYDINYRIAYASVYRCRNEKINCELAENKLQDLLAKFPNKAELIELEQVLIFVER